MRKLWAPWRMEYVGNAKQKKCFLCADLKDKKNDKKNYVLYRGKTCFIVLNAYPYSNGHLLIAPYRHIPDITNLKDAETLELTKLCSLATKILKKGLKAQGFNIGINMGKVSGAGLTGHLHIHVVPRWQGDTNFMPILSDSKVISQALEETYEILKKSIQSKK
jgi:ATP adenylyltransferase